MLLILFPPSAFADSPAAPAPPPPPRTEELLSQIVRVLEEQAQHSIKVRATMTRWEYRCIDQFALKSADSLTASLDDLGGEGWELVSVAGGAPGTLRYCFKRPGAAQQSGYRSLRIDEPDAPTLPSLSSSGGEIGCSPACSGSETCYKGVCIAACTPACADDQYCSNDHRCRTRTRPRK